jgi:hypothetical protein
MHQPPLLYLFHLGLRLPPLISAVNPLPSLIVPLKRKHAHQQKIRLSGPEAIRHSEAWKQGTLL